MAVVTPTVLHPSIAVTNSPPGVDCAERTFFGAVQSYVAAIETELKLVQALNEQLCIAVGNGIISGGTIAAGTGLACTVTALEAIAGSYVQTSGTTTISGLTLSSTNSIFIRQDGTFSKNTTGAAPDTTDGHGSYLLLGTAVTNATVVTSVTNNKTLVPNLTGFLSKSVAGAVNVTLTVAEARNSTIILTGAITANIDVIVPLDPGMKWTIVNSTTGSFTVTVKVSGGTGVAVTQAKTSGLYCNATDVAQYIAEL